MKAITYLLLLICGMAAAQRPYTNRPEIITPIMESFSNEAGIRGIEVKERLAAIDSITVGQTNEVAGADHTPHSWGYCTIRMRASDMGDEFKQMRRIFHELGHHFGLKDCSKCKYNIMSANGGDRAAFLFKDEYLRMLYIDMYFEALRNPKKWNDGHQHY